MAFVIAAVAAAGMPPLAGFTGKALLLQAAGQTPWAAWAFTVVLASGLALMVALARAGSVMFWELAPAGSPMPEAGPMPPARAAPAQSAALAMLLAGVATCAVAAGPLAAFTAAAGAQLLDRRPYVAAVLGAQPVPPAYDVRREMRERGEVK